VAIAGIVLLVFGAVAEFATSRQYTEKHVLANAGGCRIDLIVVQRAGAPEGSEAGAVVLFHGLSANKAIMRYLARAFAEEGLRVYVPDLPGHGRTAGPFSPDADEACALSLLRGLAARGLIRPERTILAGHSMGGAIALRVAAKFRPAGVIAFSPAPMASAHGVSPEALLYHSPPQLLPNTLITAGQFEPKGLRENARDLAASSTDPSVQFALIPLNSHVSVLFSATVARMAQEWAAKVLQLPEKLVSGTRLPSRLGLLGGMFGLVGILLLARPFIRECIALEKNGELTHETSEVESGNKLGKLRVAADFALVSLAVVLLLRYWVPLRPIRLFEGDYLASFFLFAGLILALLHLRLAQAKFRVKISLLLGAAFAGVVLHLLLTGWMQLTLTGAWLTVDRWIRFPIFLVATFLFLYALELVLGPVVAGEWRARWLLGIGLVAVAWLALSFGVVVLHSGEILLVLLWPYFALLFVLAGLGAQLVRRASGSATAAAVFGAIIVTGFCLVLFPVL
jgi:pimeloyl-ACP methyl ester carboxylesterase